MVDERGQEVLDYNSGREGRSVRGARPPSAEYVRCRASAERTTAARVMFGPVIDGGVGASWHVPGTLPKVGDQEAALARTADTYDRIAAEYEATTNEASPALAALREALVERTASGGVILDLGCGPGRDVGWFARRGFDVIGIDRSWSMAGRAARRGPVLRSDILCLPVASASADAVWSCASLLHVPGRALRPTLRESRRVLRPGGHLALTTSTGGTEGVEVVPYSPERGPRSSAHLDRWFANHDESELLAGLTGAGFRIEQIDRRQGHVAWVDVLSVVEPTSA